MSQARFRTFHSRAKSQPPKEVAPATETVIKGEGETEEISEVSIGSDFEPYTPGVVYYLGQRPNKTEEMPGTFDPEDGFYTVEDSMESYVFDRIDKDGRRWVLCNHPGHLIAFAMLTDGDGQHEYEVAASTRKAFSKKISAFSVRHRTTVDERGRVSFQDKTDVQSMDEASVAELVG
ncbi:hypothetical protein CMI37_35440 [Candidatus Pacearchaeota archaeon]|nr:hypothetical protein [Candidatus Pacearchaeota archaeon]|tara:strand:- start:560 stop:1090 length:531 start_codon:yes stop_codon:yes gene_type:complete